MPSRADWIISRDDVERKFVTFGEIIERAGEERDIVLQADALASFDEVLSTDTAKFRIVEDEIAELCALLDKIHLREPSDLVVEARQSDEFAQNETRVIETERLVEIARQ